jgi:metallo-beta-lactamase family protein
MLTGGRVKHHLANNLGRSESTLLFVGYQAVGTLGRILLDGAEQIRLFGQVHPVKIKIEKIDGFSSHADQDGLLAWLSDIRIPPRRVFITHGEEKAASSFAKILSNKTGWKTKVPQYKETVELF